MLVFFDSSSFAKHYVQELGSKTVAVWCVVRLQLV